MVVAGNSYIRNIMKILQFLFICLLSLNVSFANDFIFNDTNLKVSALVLNEEASEAEEEPDCE